MKGIHIFLADGFEEIEALATLDVLRRGQIKVSTVSVTEAVVITGAHGVQVAADKTWSGFQASVPMEEATRNDVMIFPGGMPGTKFLAEKQELMTMMKRHYAEGGTVAAICAAPGLVVSQLPTLEGKKFTCYDGFEAALTAKGGEYVRAPFVVDNNLITGRGPGCAVDFALAILSHLKGQAIASETRAAMMI